MTAECRLPVGLLCRRRFRLCRRANHRDLFAHPASLWRALRAIVTTREAGSGGREVFAAGSKSMPTNECLADVKSQRPDTPMLVSSAMREKRIVAIWWPTSPAHQGDCV